MVPRRPIFQGLDTGEFFAFQKLDEETNLCMDFINLCSFFAPEKIPMEIIRTGAVHLPDGLASAVCEPLLYEEILFNIRAYSLMDIEHDYISIHPLMQMMAQDRLDERERQGWVRTGLKIVNEAFDLGENDLKKMESCSRLLPHAEALIKYSREYGFKPKEFNDILKKLALFKNAFKSRAS